MKKSEVFTEEVVDRVENHECPEDESFDEAVEKLVDLGLSEVSVNGEVVKVKKVEKEKKDKVDKAELKKAEMLRAIEEGNLVVAEQKLMMSKGQMIMEGAYAKINKYVDAIRTGYSTGLLVLGEPGLGKSYTVRKILARENMSYESVEAYITPPELFLLLYRCRRKGMVALLDDCHKLLEDPRCLSYLKCALASVNERNAGRVVTNATQKPLQDPVSGRFVPNSFLFEGNVIILTNVLNEKNSHIKAVVSRLDHVKLSFSEEEKFELMAEIVKLPREGISEVERRYCLDYLVENSKMCPKYMVNLRTLTKLFDYYSFCKTSNGGVFDSSSFDIMGRGLLDLDNDGIDDSDIICVRMLESRSDLNRTKRCEEFMKLTGKSRITYFRVLKKADINRQDEEGEVSGG